MYPGVVAGRPLGAFIPAHLMGEKTGAQMGEEMCRRSLSRLVDRQDALGLTLSHLALLPSSELGVTFHMCV